MNASRAVLDVHLLQTLPPSCLNRDDTNSPKSAVYGGARRARVSSQSWKRATRMYFNQHLEATETALRTRKLAELLASRLSARLGGSEADEATTVRLINTATGALLGLKGDKLKAHQNQEKLAELEYALFISESAIAAALDQLEAAARGQELNVDALRQAMTRGHSLDVALFGRMVADTPDLNVDAACQVAHAISTHRVASEFDFYTAVDDLAGEDESGAAMLGYVEFNSATLYRYATVSLGRLADNLGDPAAVAPGVRAFVEAFAKSLPTGHQNTFAAATLPDLVFVSLRTDQPVSLVGAFEKPVESTVGYAKESAKLLAERAEQLDELYGVPRLKSWASYLPELKDVSSILGESLSFPVLLEELQGAVAGELGS